MLMGIDIRAFFCPLLLPLMGDWELGTGNFYARKALINQL